MNYAEQIQKIECDMDKLRRALKDEDRSAIIASLIDLRYSASVFKQDLEKEENPS